MGTGVLPDPLRDTSEKLFSMVRKQRQNAMRRKVLDRFGTSPPNLNRC
jgi:hypothetical protein